MKEIRITNAVDYCTANGLSPEDMDPSILSSMEKSLQAVPCIISQPNWKQVRLAGVSESNDAISESAPLDNLAPEGILFDITKLPSQHLCWELDAPPVRNLGNQPPLGAE